MFYNGRKTIGVFMNRAEMEFQRNLCTALIENAHREDYNIAFMTSYEIRRNENTYDIYGDIIVDFAPIEQFDAIVVALDTYDMSVFREKLVRALKERAKCPVITYREKDNSFYGVLSDANMAVRELVEHFATIHHARNIFFMSGYKDHYDSMKRLTCYQEAMEEFGLPVFENSVFFGDLWKHQGEQALQYFYSDKDHCPDAIICANDFMARALCDAAARHDISVPQDLMISGIDNAPEAREIEPALTTVAMDYPRMAAETIHLITDLLAGQKRAQYISVPAKILYRESCGCMSENDRKTIFDCQNHYRQTADLVEEHTRQTFFKIDMAGCHNFNEMMEMVIRNLHLAGDCSSFYLCLLGKRDRNGIPVFQKEIPDKAEAILGWKNGKVLDLKDASFDRAQLLPPQKHDNEPQAYFLTMLHDRVSTFGYTAINFKRPQDGIGIFYYDWNLTIALSINEFYAHQRIQVLLQKNDQNSITDFLTQMNNRRGLARYINKNWPKWMRDRAVISFISIDVDGLKYINDHYGHEEGDRAICAIARAVKTTAPRNASVSRTGGDEFLIIVEGNSERAEEIEKETLHQLEMLNIEKEEKYAVEASIGTYTTVIDGKTSCQECIRLSDMEMYRNKRIKKKGRAE